ncbi:sigma-70 family RNA polymerase sigma factor [Nocardioides immobilis]|uniref:Sigma-70 family RNA polymerase sigma factor n=2 Tax=Nocardioides immobilis TaxID=2049295 RepID=A0A417XWN9_9ACTN|nr:sigma-70 family RNA polymerase sigma factor [Nocardioides immobilis]
MEPAHRSVEPIPSSAQAEPPDRKRRTAELIAQAAECEGDERQAILDEVILLNIPVAHALASRYRNRGQPIEELEQVACLALTKAVRAYDPARGDDLLVFAVPSILGELKRYFRDVTWTVRPPRRIQELRPRLSEAEEELTQQLGRPPRPSEVAEYVGCSTEDVLEAHESVTCASPDSLNESRPGDGDFAWIERLPSEEFGFQRAEAVAVLGPACRRLKRRDRQILEMRFFEQKTQQQIADELGVTQVQVSRLLQRILTDLRRSITGQRRPVKAA